jgi:hypothetical protein
MLLKIQHRSWLLRAGLASCAFTSACFADTFLLKDGKELRGSPIHVVHDRITIRTDSSATTPSAHEVTIEKDSIKSIALPSSLPFQQRPDENLFDQYLFWVACNDTSRYDRILLADGAEHIAIQTVITGRSISYSQCQHPEKPVKTREDFEQKTVPLSDIGSVNGNSVGSITPPARYPSHWGLLAAAQVGVFSRDYVSPLLSAVYAQKYPTDTIHPAFSAMPAGVGVYLGFQYTLSPYLHAGLAQSILYDNALHLLAGAQLQYSYPIGKLRPFCSVSPGVYAYYIRDRQGVMVDAYTRLDSTTIYGVNVNLRADLGAEYALSDSRSIRFSAGWMQSFARQPYIEGLGKAAYSSFEPFMVLISIGLVQKFMVVSGTAAAGGDK